MKVNVQISPDVYSPVLVRPKFYRVRATMKGVVTHEGEYKRKSDIPVLLIGDRVEVNPVYPSYKETEERELARIERGR